MQVAHFRCRMLGGEQAQWGNPAAARGQAFPPGITTYADGGYRPDAGDQHVEHFLPFRANFDLIAGIF